MVARKSSTRFPKSRRSSSKSKSATASKKSVTAASHDHTQVKKHTRSKVSVKRTEDPQVRGQDRVVTWVGDQDYVSDFYLQKGCERCECLSLRELPRSDAEKSNKKKKKPVTKTKSTVSKNTRRKVKAKAEEEESSTSSTSSSSTSARR